MGTWGGGVFDVENRLTRNSGTLAWAYSYAPGNKRVWRGVWSSGVQTVDEITFWGANGQKLETYQVSQYQPYPADDHTMPQLVATQTGTNYYFGGRLIKNAGGYVTPDRLGSIGKYFPYGQERPSATTDGKEKFATYFRDSETGLDYATNRYHQPGMGRFMTADPTGGDPKIPDSFNKYSYTGGDPVNRFDPSGAAWVCLSVEFCWEEDNLLTAGDACMLSATCSQAGNDNCLIAVMTMDATYFFSNCAIQQAGGGGAGGAYIPQQTPDQTTSDLERMASTAMASLNGSCQKALDDVGLFNDMVNDAAGARFFQAFGTTGNMTLSSIGYVSPDGRAWTGNPTLAAWCNQAIACDAGTAGILVTTDYYNESASDQLTTMVHELLHYALAAQYPNDPTKYDDVGTANFLGLGTFVEGQNDNASRAITRWLNGGCP